MVSASVLLSELNQNARSKRCRFVKPLICSSAVDWRATFFPFFYGWKEKIPLVASWKKNSIAASPSGAGRRRQQLLLMTSAGDSVADFTTFYSSAT